MSDCFRICEDQKKIKLDLKDRKILSLLSENSRMPLTQMAHKVQLSRDAVNYRIKRMVTKGVIQRFFPIVDLKRFGYYTYHIFLVLDEKDQGEQAKFIEELKQHPNVKYVIEHSDRWDLEISLVAKDLKDFDKVNTDIVSKHPNLILEKEKLALIKGYHSIHLPQVIYWEADQKVKFEKEETKPIKLDEKDFKILKLLSKDARMSSAVIGGKIGLSHDSVSVRIRQMQKANIIRKFTVLVNLSALDYNWYTYVIQMRLIDNKTDRKLREFIRQHPYVIRAVQTLGTWDLLLHIVSDSPTQFHKTVKEIKNEFADTIKNYATYIAFKEHYYEPFPDVIKFDSEK
ncbi:MAG: Lrp/AsnC family transcriptional regulator [archaeon]